MRHTYKERLPVKDSNGRVLAIAFLRGRRGRVDPLAGPLQQGGDACTEGATNEGVNVPVRPLDELGTWEASASP